MKKEQKNILNEIDDLININSQVDNNFKNYHITENFRYKKIPVFLYWILFSELIISIYYIFF